MNLSDWRKQTRQVKKALIKANGKGLSWNAMQESLDYIDHLIAHIYRIKYVEKLNRYSCKAAAEFCRWQSIAADGSKLFKVDNNLTADINQWLLRTFPELEGFLHSRKMAGKV